MSEDLIIGLMCCGVLLFLGWLFYIEHKKEMKKLEMKDKEKVASAEWHPPLQYKEPNESPLLNAIERLMAAFEKRSADLDLRLSKSYEAIRDAVAPRMEIIPPDLMVPAVPVESADPKSMECQNCRHWERNHAEARAGACRRYPPEKWETANDIEWVFPETSETAKCGEWEP